MKIKKAVKNTAIGLMVVSQMANGMVLAAPETAIKEFKPVKEVRQELQKFKGEIKLFIMKDGQRVRVDQMMQDGLRVVAGRTCVGVRDLVNAIEGARVDWDQANQIVDIEYQGKQISYPLNKPVMWNGSQMITIDVPAQVDPSISRTFLPIRNIAETLGFKVDWNQNTKEVTLTPGAGSGVTSATKPSTPSTSNLVTASGDKLLTVAEFKNFKEGQTWEVALTKADYTDNGGPVITVLKDTPLEFQIHKPFRRVSSSPANPNFKIIGDNVGDSRIGTYMFGPGDPIFDEGVKMMLERMSYNKKYTYTSLDGRQYTTFGWNQGLLGSNHLTKMLPENRLISKAEADRFRKNFDKMLIKEYYVNKTPDLIGDSTVDKVMKDPKTKFYDMTGIIDAHSEAIVSGSPRTKVQGGSMMFLTKEGHLIPGGNPYNIAKTADWETIDKVIYILETRGGLREKSTWNVAVVDVPDLKNRMINNQDTERFHRKTNRFPDKLITINRGW